MTITAKPPALRDRTAYRTLEDHHKRIATMHLRELFTADPERGARMTVSSVTRFLE